MASHAFKAPSVGLWNVEPARLADRLPKIAAFADGTISDVFVPGSASRAQADAIRATRRPDGTNLRAQLYAVARATTPEAFAAQADADSRRLGVGVVELNIEKPHAELADYVRRSVAAFRKLRPVMKLRVNVGAFCGFGLLGAPFGGDGNLYAIEQAYYGLMEPVNADEALTNLLDHGVPRDRASVMYGAAGPIGWTAAQPGVWNSARHCTLGTFWHLDGVIWRRPAHCSIFTDDLMAEVGLL